MICKDSSKWAMSYWCVIPVVSKQQRSIQLPLLDMATERRRCVWMQWLWDRPREVLFTVQRHEHCKVKLLSFPQDPNLCFPMFYFFQIPSTNRSSVIMSVRAEQPELEWKQAQLARTVLPQCLCGHQPAPQVTWGQTTVIALLHQNLLLNHCWPLILQYYVPINFDLWSNLNA